MRHSQSRVSIKEIFCATVVMTVTAAILSPVIATTKGSSALSNCQANLETIGKSLQTYLSDWNQTYPTNRLKTGNLILSCRLSQVGTDPATGKAYKFQYGTTWVEGLYNYMEPIVATNDRSSVWKCPAALAAQAGANTTEATSAATTYLYNFNLLEQPENAIRSSSNTMIVRETDRLVNANCCAWPSSVSTTGVATPPIIAASSTIISPFLRAPDQAIKNPNTGTPVTYTELVTKLHDSGSNILFADGHVKLYNAGLYFRASALMGGNYWDTTDGAFYNTTLAAYGPTVRKAIRVTP